MKFPGWITALAAAISAAVLPACDFLNVPRIRPGITTRSEVSRRLGAPDFIHPEQAGGETWEFGRQPNGTACYMVTFGADGIVAGFEQVLNAANYARIAPGMTPADIRRLLGAPASKIVFENLGEDIWEWRVEGSPVSEETYFMVHFDLSRGRVKKTSQRVAMKA